MILFGVGGHGKVVLNACQTEVIAFVDDNKSIQVFREREVVTYDSEYHPQAEVVIAIGDNEIRQKVAKRVKHSFGIVKAASAVIDQTASVGVGSQVLHGAILQADVLVGEHTIVNTGASIDHDCILGSYCHIAPQVTLCGSVHVGDGTIIGAGSTVVPGIKIGKWCKIGAGSVVTKDIPDFGVAVGNPARVIKIND